MSVKTYTDRFRGYQIRDCAYIGEPPTDEPPTFDVVKWEEHDLPIVAIDSKTGEKKARTEFCYSVGRLVYNRKEPCFNFKSIGLRWLEEHPPEEVERWLIKWAEYKLEELNEEYDY